MKETKFLSNKVRFCGEEKCSHSQRKSSLKDFNIKLLRRSILQREIIYILLCKLLHNIALQIAWTIQVDILTGEMFSIASWDFDSCLHGDIFCSANHRHHLHHHSLICHLFKIIMKLKHSLMDYRVTKITAIFS